MVRLIGISRALGKRMELAEATATPSRGGEEPDEGTKVFLRPPGKGHFPARNRAFRWPAPPENPPRGGMMRRVQGFTLTPRASTPAPRYQPRGRDLRGATRVMGGPEPWGELAEFSAA